MKYVRHEGIGFILWPRTDELWHVTIGRCLEHNCGGNLLSAGFVHYDQDGKPVCAGRSDSLGLGSRPDDTEALRAQLRLVRGRYEP